MEKPSNKRSSDLGDIQEAAKAKDCPSVKARGLGVSMMKYGNQNHFVEKAIIAFFILWGIATIFNVAYSAELKIVPVQQKTLANGLAYGLESGIYFELTELEPFIMYKLQYSQDLKKWTDMVHLGTYKMAMTSPYYTWDELPKDKCFFRIVVAW